MERDLKDASPYEYKKNKQRQSMTINTEKRASFSPDVATLSIDEKREGDKKVISSVPSKFGQKGDYNRRKTVNAHYIEPLDSSFKDNSNSVGNNLFAKNSKSNDIKTSKTMKSNSNSKLKVEEYS